MTPIFRHPQTLMPNVQPNQAQQNPSVDQTTLKTYYLGIHARAALQLGNYQLAYQHAQEVLKINPEDPFSLNTCISSCISLSKYDEAANASSKLFAHVNEINRFEKELLFNSCSFLCQISGNPAGALHYINTLLTLNPYNLDAQKQLALIHGSELAKNSSSLSPIDALFNKALLQIRTGHSDFAISCISKINEHDVSSPKSYQIKALWYLSQGQPDYKSAYEMTNHAVSMDPTDMESIALRAYTGYFVNLETAIVDTEIVLKSNPNSRLFTSIYTIAKEKSKNANFTLDQRVDQLRSMMFPNTNPQAVLIEQCTQIQQLNFKSDAKSIYQRCCMMLQIGNTAGAVADSRKLLMMNQNL